MKLLGWAVISYDRKGQEQRREFPEWQFRAALDYERSLGDLIRAERRGEGPAAPVQAVYLFARVFE